jgi:transposase-like protein
VGEDSNESGRGKEIIEFDRDTIEREIRGRVRQIIEQVVEAELDAALGAKVSERVGERREGYRHGYRDRSLTTSVGPTQFTMPRARLRERFRTGPGD